MSGVETDVKPVAELAPEPVQQPSDSHDEEYESADDAYDEEEVEEIEVEEEVEEEEEEDDEEEEEERSASQQEKENDDDEDAKNPQAAPEEFGQQIPEIPKRGYFYEHDDRTKEEDQEEEEEPKKEEKKLPVGKEPSRWSHDLFKEEDQAPKSKEELSRAYGYDIFTEEQAPRARRRRRYGRGPNKYTRQWEDEEAYQKPRGGGGGFRGRGQRGGRGNFRGSNRRVGDENNSTEQEEFPALPGTPDSTSNKSASQPSQQQAATKPALNKDQTQRRGSGEHPRPSYQGQDSRRRYNDHDNERTERSNTRASGSDSDRNYGSRGGGSRGGGGPSSGGRGRGRRNEFSNRNRYPNPNKRDGDEEGGNQNQQQQKGYNEGGQPSERERPANRVRPSTTQAASFVENKDSRSRGQPHPHQQTNGHIRDSQRPKDSPLPSKPPFTNTEYTGSHSLTASMGGGGGGGNRQQSQGYHHHEDSSKKGQVHPNSNVLAEKGFTDLRDVINSKRHHQQQQQQQTGQSERRTQIPPRMQQQQVHSHQHQQQQQQQQQQHTQVLSQHHHHQQQQQPPQHQVQQEHQPSGQTSGKPKRFSAQRQRQTDPSATSVGVMGHVPPNMIPVVSGSDQMVPSPVPAYPQAPTYYEGPQVYETSGSPVTVVSNVGTNGTSVSPSLWAPHAYAPNAPYPSPPTGPQVPPAFAPDHAAYLAQQAGPIYSAPPPFIQDPTMMNYNTGAPPFAPAYHPQAGYQGFPQVTPAPPPELYHAGVTYYNPQPQIQRQPPMLVPKPRTKSVLQLVEPPEKTKGERSGSAHLRDSSHQYDQHSEHSQSPPVSSSYAPPDSNVHGHVEAADLVQQFEGVSLTELQAPLEEGHTVEQMRKPSPLPEQESWSAQMEDTNDPIGTSFIVDPGQQLSKPSAIETCTTQVPIRKDKSNSPQPPVDETKKDGE